jgi:rSAM/selenodomain-associated transferase 1
MEQYLIVYAKQPTPGYAKTRLGATIGSQQAAGVYARLLYAYLLQLLHANLTDTTVELSVASSSDVPYFAAAFPEFTVHPQVEGDLGRRMAASFEQAFAAGADSVVLTGSDIPRLDIQTLRAAFCALKAAPVVVGPASDGGYYLIGMRTPGAPLFEGVSWSSKHTLAQTEALAQAQGIAISYLPEQSDLDTQEDFERWHKSLTNDPIGP